MRSPVERILIIDSGSNDNSLTTSIEAGYQVEYIDQLQFDHGATRNVAVNLCSNCEFVIFLAQDAVLADCDSLRRILASFSDNKVAAVCGRQLPRKSASLMESHARLYNYPEQSVIRSILDKDEFGLRTAFLSNSFAAYRVSILNEIGRFPEKVIYGEDMYVAAKLLKAGYKISYAADACVYHSHHYSIWQETQRYFDMGVFHSNEEWIRNEFGGAEGEAVKFVVSECRYLFHHAHWLILTGLLRALMRYVGFRLGLISNVLPLSLNKLLAQNKGYFNK